MRYPWTDGDTRSAAELGLRTNAEVIALTQQLQFALLAALAGGLDNAVPGDSGGGLGLHRGQARQAGTTAPPAGEER